MMPACKPITFQGSDMGKMPHGRIISVAGFKGGSGKSTTALSLAVHWHVRDDGTPAALIDGDPQASIATWRQGGEPINGLAVVADHSDNIAATIDRLAVVYSPVVIDTPGFRNRTTIAALAAADIAIIPVKPSKLDLAVAAKTYRLVEELNETQERQGRPIVARLLLTMTQPGTVVARHMRGEIERAGLPLLTAEMANRVAYAEASLDGLTPTISDPDGAAARDIAAIAAEIDTLKLSEVPALQA
jgi:chromosome partitioning protein